MLSKVIRRSTVLRESVRVAGGIGCAGELPECGVLPDEAGAQATEALSDARAAAAALLAQAQAEAEALRGQARSEGFEEGRQLGMTAARQEMAAGVAEIMTLAASARDDCALAMAQLERALPELALAVAGKIVASELMQHPDAIAAIVAQAASVLRDQSAVRVRVAPQDLEVLAAYWSDLWPEERGPAPALVADPAMERGGCVIETRLGALDGRLATRFVEIGRAFGLGLVEEPPERSDV